MSEHEPIIIGVTHFITISFSFQEYLEMRLSNTIQKNHNI